MSGPELLVDLICCPNLTRSITSLIFYNLKFIQNLDQLSKFQGNRHAKLSLITTIFLLFPRMTLEEANLSLFYDDVVVTVSNKEIDLFTCRRDVLCSCLCLKLYSGC
jgi:hypothetical protein